MSDKRETFSNTFKRAEDTYKLVAITDPEEPLTSTQTEKFYSCFKCFKDGDKVVDFYLPEFYTKDQVKKQFQMMKKNIRPFLLKK